MGFVAVIKLWELEVQKRITCSIVALLLAANPALANVDKATKREAPATFRDLIACGQIADNVARLTCYDRQIASFEQAESKGDVLVADRNQVEEAQRGLFGYSILKSNLLSGKKGEDINQVEFTVASARQYDYGRWRITMEDGSVWDQIGTDMLAFNPKSGNKVVIKRASFGSYAAKIGGQPPIKVRRVQ